MSKFGENLKKLRISKDMTQLEVAELIGVSKSAISMYENSQREPSFEILESIADHFNVPLSSLISEEDAALFSASSISTIAAHAIDDLTEEEQLELIDYAKYLKSKRRK